MSDPSPVSHRPVTRRVLLIALLGLVIVGAAVVLLPRLGEAPAPRVTTEERIVPPVPPPAAAGRSNPTPAPARPPPEPQIKPSFDVVRINPQGDAVMAGRAAPGAEVLAISSSTRRRRTFEGQLRFGNFACTSAMVQIQRHRID